MKKIFIDLETTGTSPRIHSIYQISGLVEIDNEVVEEFNFHVQPHPKAKYAPEALVICGKTEEELKAYPPMKRVYNNLIMLFGKYIDRYDRNDKAWMVGFNNRAFDDIFLRAWFEQNDDTFIGSWFYPDSLDVLVLASQYLLDRRKDMPNFQLKTVAAELGVIVDESKLHDSSYDIFLTREVYRIVTGLQPEL